MVRGGNRPEEGRAQGSGTVEDRERGSCFGTSSALRVVCGLDWGPWWVLVEPLNQLYKVKRLVTREAQTERGGEGRLCTLLLRSREPGPGFQTQGAETDV